MKFLVLVNLNMYPRDEYDAIYAAWARLFFKASFDDTAEISEAVLRDRDNDIVDGKAVFNL